MDKEKACLRLLEIASNKQLSATDKIHIISDVLDLYSQGYLEPGEVRLSLTYAEAATLKQKLTDVYKINTEATEMYTSVDQGLEQAQEHIKAYQEENEYMGAMGHVMTVMIGSKMYTMAQFEEMKKYAKEEVEFTTALLNKMEIEGI